MHSIRVVCIDSYQAVPIPDIDPTFSQFRGSDIKQVPILRVFGITLGGEKVCVHIHGVFPYLYIPYTGQIKADILSYQLAASLDSAINVSLGSAKAKTQHVYKIQQVSGIPFYGYHRKKHHFFKIYFYNPAMMKRATELLQTGCILDQSFQPHEAHIPYTLQFMIDYNVYGMSTINLKSAKHRRSSSTLQDEKKPSQDSSEIFSSDMEEKEYLPYSVTRQSVCKLEIDAWASDILNREVIDKGIELNPGIAIIWEEEKARRAQADLGGDSQLTYPSSPERSQAAKILTDNDIYLQTRLAQRLCAIEFQGDESSLTPSTDNSYPIPVPDDSNLLDASLLEIHAGPLDSTSLQRSLNQFDQDLVNESLIHTLQTQASLNELSFNSSDLNVVDMLANLAQDQDDNLSPIDSNSILGSQKSQPTYKDFPTFQDNDFAEEEEEEEVPDLNLTNLQLDTLNFSTWESDKDNLSTKSNESQIELVLESLNDPLASNLSDDIPQLDGPIDDENSKAGTSNEEDPNQTIERKEFVICNYRGRSGSTTPGKRKRISSSDEDDSRDGTKNKRPIDNLPTTPRRTHKRSNKLTSPSCPTRNYSPLNVEISSAQKTPKRIPKNSPCVSPSTSALSQRKMREKKHHRKRIFSPVKELNYEDASNLVDQKSTGQNLKEKNISTIQESSKHLDEEHTPTDSGSIIPASKISEELFTSDPSTPKSDDTLVEDSDDSLQTVVPSPPLNPVIINESDSDDASSLKDNRSDLSAYQFPHDTLPSLIEEENAVDENELPCGQIIRTEEKILKEKSCTDSNEEVEDDGDLEITIISSREPPSREHVINTMKLYGISKFDDMQSSSSQEESTNTQSQQVGKALKSTKDAIDINEFRFSYEGVEDFETQPSVKSVEAWLKAQEEKKKEKEKEDKEKDNMPADNNRQSQKSFESDDSLSRVFKAFANDASKHLGISCGQIECNTRASINIADGNLGNAKALSTYQYLTILCLEVHVLTRPNLLPDPRYDPIAAIFYAVHNDVPPDWAKAKPLDCGIIIVDSNKGNPKFTSSYNSTLPQQSLIYVENEEDIFDQVLKIIERCDPDMLIGWDIEFLSWGYMFQRASIFNKSLSGKISRIPSTKCNWEAAQDHHSQDLHIETLAEVRLPGRIVLEIWRIMKYEIALTSYTYENIMYNVLNERVPHQNFDVLTKWWNFPNQRWRVIDHYANKVIGVHRLLHHLDIINRTSEHARLYGVQFFEVFSRGSQFRVESMMLRLAKPLNYIPVSPSAHQRGCMRAPESLPLIMEPESTIYYDPVIVLDFQSLYPSIIIAYNYCFSTCLGRVELIGSHQPFEFGCTTLKVQKNLAMKLQKKINFAPCGVAFVKKEVREGILPRMLTEILETRLMVKKAIKDHSKEDRALQRALHSRQLGLKLIANVTYGYTAANFSGRMPCIEVGDSVVSKGKETLERAIKIVESTPKWGARVIYGDTDSLFVLLKGKSREEAFDIGAEIADTVTAANPKPVKLKFEKVMQPCVLQTKKRYCGYMYENLNDKPVYLAKGIETVRRDGCPAVAKILEKSLRVLFDTKDVSLVKEYVIRQLDKILSGRASIQDLTFAKEFRGMKGYKAAACVPALELTKRLIQKDPRAVPRTGSRVPYIIVAGGPNVPLIRCVRSPMELIQDPYLRPNAVYYITKVVIPPLNRCLNLIGVDALAWYMEMPHRQNLNRIQGAAIINHNRKQKTTISQYLYNTNCLCCEQTCDKGICIDCAENQSHTLILLHEKCRQNERIYSNIKLLCESCTGVMDADSCTSLDCPIFYRRIEAQRDVTQISYLYDLIQCVEHLT